MYGVAIDTRVASAPAGVLQRHRPYLHKIKGKDTTELENGGYVSKSSIWDSDHTSFLQDNFQKVMYFLKVK